MSTPASVAWETERTRPGILRTLAWVGVGGWLGSILALIALWSPALLGVASVQAYNNGAMVWFSLDTLGGVVANAATMATLVWGCTWGIRGVFRAGGGSLPASTWTALTLAPAVLAAGTTLATTAGAGIVAALALRLTAFRADGTPRPEPLDALGPRARNVLRVALPALAIGTATAYAIYHPLTMWWGSGEQPRPGRATFTANLPQLNNEGGRAVRILAIEPGVERGYALHLTGVRIQRPSGLEPTLPFRPFTLAPHAHAHAPGLVLQVSRAGCRPGQSGRIESVRVRYRLGGERTMLLRLGEPLALAC